ncbi:GntR family transcriptional regulator [Paludisphaera rhizosphaerae]|uniref:GntR family transcriptional regulator n=1 Tax=Paludisphaera rhizosphaerae TaxID=2711216 RepID=UPI0013ECD55A|nr:GntR family transcriptional regulator [Paludisphaera rhizosphaerae]
MLQPRKLADQVYDHLLRMILAGELEPGSPLQETDLAARLGVSRTPVREALGRLSEFGVVVTRANHTAVVRPLGAEELVHFHQVREALEGMAAELACGKLTAEDFARLESLAEAARDPKRAGYLDAFNEFDRELHAIVAERSGNPVLAREIGKLHRLTMIVHEQLEPILIRGGRYGPEDQVRLRQAGFEQHCAIVALLRDGSPAACRQAMIDHIRYSCEYKVGLMPEAAPPRGPARTKGRPTPA